MFSKSTLTVIGLAATLFASQANSWTVGLYATQNSCGGDWAPDTSRSGAAKQTSSCIGHGLVDVQAMNISNWDDGCRISCYDDWMCDHDPIVEFRKENEELVDNNWSCINGLEKVANFGNFEAIKYICD